MISIKPVNARTLVKPIPKEEVILGSLILPDGGMGDLEEALALSDFNIIGADGVNTLVKEGERVIYSANSGITQQVGGQFLKWVVITDIWGIVLEDKTDRLKDTCPTCGKELTAQMSGVKCEGCGYFECY